jgi:hypothetical protein
LYDGSVGFLGVFVAGVGPRAKSPRRNLPMVDV